MPLCSPILLPTAHTLVMVVSFPRQYNIMSECLLGLAHKLLALYWIITSLDALLTLLSLSRDGTSIGAGEF